MLATVAAGAGTGGALMKRSAVRKGAHITAKGATGGRRYREAYFLSSVSHEFNNATREVQVTCKIDIWRRISGSALTAGLSAVTTRKRESEANVMENDISGGLILAARLLLVALFLIFGWRKLTDYSGTVSRMVLPVLDRATSPCPANCR
jgi:hypothetical protein